MQHPLIEMMAAMGGMMECHQKEKENPKQEAPPDYTPTQALLAEMLIQNTGCNILDSGGAYGRSWERNRHIQDFRNLSKFTVRINPRGDFDLSYNIFHFLDASIERTKEAEQIEKGFYAFASNHEDYHWPECIEEYFKQKLSKRKHTPWKQSYGENTYNRNSDLSQIIQYWVYENYSGDEYVWLQIHGGCDARGGYTNPRVFYVTEEFALARNPGLFGSCNCSTADSDDSGYYWQCEMRHKDKHFEYPDTNGKLIPYWHVRENEIQGEPNYEYFCERCKTIVEWCMMI